MRAKVLVPLLLTAGPAACVRGFPVDTSDQPSTHPPLAPREGAAANTNPPSMVWRVDDRAATYTLEMCQDEGFQGDVIRVEGIDMPFYNHSQVLAEGRWYWRYLVVTPEADVSEPSPTHSFRITEAAPPLPVPRTEQILADMPGHPRIFVTPDTVSEFRARRNGPAREAWEQLKYQADQYVDSQPPEPALRPMPADPGTSRKQVFYLKGNEPFVPARYTSGMLNSDAGKANVLSFAYLVSEDERYAEAARRWMLFLSPFRMDYHLEDRAQHDTVVYNYEYGLKGMALAYDRLYDRLTEEERRQVVEHIEYHCDNAYQWCHDRLKLHLNYQNSHGQQCMHALLTTVLAVADETPRTAEWADWLIRQYVNRIAWGSDDGGYTEGQTYSHKFQFILEGLVALKTATGVDVFRKPRFSNAGPFWMYCMSLNYWWNHWGDVYSLIMPIPGASADTYISGVLASMSGDRYVKWWSNTVLGDPAHLPLWYLSSTDLEPKPPVDIAQARLFPDVGQLGAYDRFYDHDSNRIFFRSSPWGGHSHAHADQNGFVLHAGGEIMACDAGYYTYYGDTYHKQFSMATVAHNSILVNGEGQPKSISSKGRVSAFLNSPPYCLFIGDAAEAYPGMLERFDRVALFARPDVFIVYDELRATEPSQFSWVLNTFEAAEMDEGAQTMVIRQRDQRLRVRHVAPAGLKYRQSNERPYPMLTKSSCRYTEAFPQTYNIQVTTPEKRGGERILAVMDAYEEGVGPRIASVEQVEAGDALAVKFTRGRVRETVAFRKRGAEPAAISGDGIETDARAVSVARGAEGEVVRWVLHDGTRLVVDGRDVFSADQSCDAAGELESPAGAAQIHVKHEAPVKVGVRLRKRPEAVFQAPPDRPGEARPIAVGWQDWQAQFELPEAGETVLWVDPIIDLTQTPPPLELTVTDGTGRYSVALATAIADNGEIVAFGELDPREPGVYAFTASRPGTEVLVQDRWDPTLSVRGGAEVTAPWREGAEVFVRYPPDAAPQVRASLQESFRGRIVSLLRNGGFEEGIPEYPPRGWTTSHPRKMGFTWPGWSQEDAAEGRSCLKFVRPEQPMTLRSQPMRLHTGGRYVFRFQARGNATEAQVTVSGQRGTSAQVAVLPSEDWREYRTELEVQPGYCTVNVVFGGGGDPDQVVWVDDMEFGSIAH